MTNERTLTGSMSTALAGSVLRPAILVYLDILTDPLTVWSGPGVYAPSGTGDADLNGKIFTNLAPLVEISDVAEDQGIGGPVSITAAGHDLDEDLLRQVVRDKKSWRGRTAIIWLALIDIDEKTVLSDPVKVKKDIMVNMTTNRSAAQSTVTVTIDADLGRARSAPFRWLDHSRLDSTDRWSAFILELANRPSGFESKESAVSVAVGDDVGRGEGHPIGGIGSIRHTL